MSPQFIKARRRGRIAQDYCAEKVCLLCEKNFTPKVSFQKYCGDRKLKTGCAGIHYKAYKAKMRKSWRSRHPDLHRAHCRTYYENNKEKKFEYDRKWKKDNPEKVKLYSRNSISRNRVRIYHTNRQYAARRRGSQGTYTLVEWEQLKQTYDFTCPQCFRSEPEITLTRDHKIPLILGGTNQIDNIQPLCFSCNCSKGKKIWFASYPINYMKNVTAVYTG